jgi:hypothetical protein
MRQQNLAMQHPARSRRISGRAQDDHILDPYQRQHKPEEGTFCPQCGAVFQRGRWDWAAKPLAAHEQTCPACRRIADKLPAGLLTLNGLLIAQRRQELVSLARHEETAEKAEHPLNRIMSIEDDGERILISTTDIHLPHRIGEAIRRAFRGRCETNFDENGYFVRVIWTPAVGAQ